MKKKLTAILLGMLMPAMLFSVNVSAMEEYATSEKYNVEYITHVQDYGWETIWKSNGDLSGTVGESKRLEALRVKLTGADLPSGATIQTYVHVQNEGDLGPFAMGNVAGTEGKGQRLERITMNLINLPDHQLRYNVQVQNIGWLRDENDVATWFVGGESAGTSGKGYRLEAIKIVLVETNEAFDAYKKALAAVHEENYTSLSWIYYQAKVEANAVTEEDDKETIIAATAAITEAQKSLVKASDLSAYNKAIASVNEADYTPETWEAYQDVVWSNYVTKDDSQASITAATKKIVDAQKSLQRKINLTRYYEVLAAANESDYLPESWVEYQQVLAANVVTEADSQTAIDAAVKIIEEAQKKMVRRLDFTGYKSLLNSVREADYTVESWSAYQDVVDANVMTEDNTQTDIEKAMANISAAQKNLVKAADLSAYEAALAAVQQTDFTPASWLTYQNVVKASKVTAASGQAAIDAATEKILAAQLKLVEKGDFSAYEEALAAVNQNDYTPVSWMAYMKVVAANKASAASSQDAIDKATDKILTAQYSLVRKGDLTNYKNTLEAVKATNYTTASWTEYQKVVKANVMTSNNPQSDIDLATENIIAAQEKLEFKGGDLRAYDAALAKAKQADYTTVSWKAYQKVVEANVVTGENKQTEIDAAVKNIQAAQSALVKKGDLTAYNIALAGLDEADYTATSWKAYQNVVKANVRTAEDLQVAIDLSTTKILAAQKSLVMVGDLTAYNEALAAVRKENYTTASWNAYQLVVKANVRTKDEAQLVIDSSVQKILAAQKLLERKYDTSAYNALLAAVKQANYTPASWTSYQSVVKAYPASYSPIKTAIEAIEAAQASKLVKIVDLTAYKNALAAVIEAEYTIDSWEKYKAVVNANVVTTANTQAQIDDATKKIIEAQKLILKKKVNLTIYLKLLEDAVEYDYSPASWAAYQKILSKNVVTENNTQTEVDAAVKAITVAQNNVLVRRLDYSKYDELLKVAPINPVDPKIKDLYTDVSWGIYEKVVKENTLTKNKEIDTQTGIDKAVVNIAAAQKKLVKAGDLTAYNLVLNAAKIENYTSASWAIYLKVLEANEMTKNHSQADIDAATEKIRLAQLKLAQGGDMTAYTKLMNDFKADQYTSVSWAIYQKVIDANFVSSTDGQTKINAAVAKLSEASRKLVPRASDLDYAEYTRVIERNFQRIDNAADNTDPDKLRKMDEKEYTTSSWAVYQKVLDANYMDRDKSQAQVKAAVVNIKKAQFKLLVGGDLGRYNNLLKYNVILGRDPDVVTDIRAPKEMKETEYTSATWTVYSKVLSSNEMDRDKSQAQIDAAVVKIERAQQKLVEKGNITAYKALLDSVKELDYTVTSWTAYEKLIATKGYAVSSDNSQAEIDRAVELIQAAQKKLKPKGNLAGYDALIASFASREDEFRSGPWQKYKDVVNAKENIVNSESTQTQITDAIRRIGDAQKVLDTNNNRATDLDDYIFYKDELLGKDADYTPESWKAYNAVISDPQWYRTKDNTATEVLAATQAFINAKKLLKPSTDLTAFVEAYELYQKDLKETDTAQKISRWATPESWAIYAAEVEKYASFENGNWVPTGSDVTATTPQSEIKLIVEKINEKKVAMMPSAAAEAKFEYSTTYAAYLTARDKLGSGSRAAYTTSSYNRYVDVCNNYTIKEPVFMYALGKGQITDYTEQIQTAKIDLDPVPTPAQVAQFSAEVGYYNNLKSGSTKYTVDTWNAYYIAYKKWNLDTVLSATDNSEDEFVQAITDMETARLALSGIVTGTINYWTGVTDDDVSGPKPAAIGTDGTIVITKDATYSVKIALADVATIVTFAEAEKGDIIDGAVDYSSVNAKLIPLYLNSPLPAGAAPFYGGLTDNDVKAYMLAAIYTTGTKTNMNTTTGFTSATDIAGKQYPFAYLYADSAGKLWLVDGARHSIGVGSDNTLNRNRVTIDKDMPVGKYVMTGSLPSEKNVSITLDVK